MMAQRQSIGLLSQTLSQCPTVRWILPARIRTKSQNDVVFVGENFVQLREALPNGRLGDVTAKAALGARILAAKVVSAKLELVPVVEQILNQAREDEVERYMINGEEIDEETPPQLVVLTLVTNELIFMFAKDHSSGKTRFIHAKKCFPRTVSLAERLGSHIAVDPESRAIAIAPTMNYLGIFALKHVDEIQNEIIQANENASHIFKPSRQDRYLQIDGTIVKMEFLPSTSDYPNKLILLVLVSRNKSTSMLLYRWDNKDGPRTAKPVMASGQELPAEDSLPLMLIPSSRCPSFVIVAETHLAVYDNVITDMAKRVSIPCRRDVPADYESSSVPPLWVQWAKPRRHAKHLEKHDDFYLVREDGELRYYVINHDSALKVDAHYSPGSLDISVDQAFAIVAAPAELGADVFLAGGDLSDGGVWHCVARQTPVCVQSLPNMAPVRDMLITGPQDRFSVGTKPVHQEISRFFTCSGKSSKSSFVNEVRFGLEAEIGCSIELEDASSVTNLWLLGDRRPERVLFLMSHPLHSSIISLDPSSLDVEVGDVNTYPGLDLESPTLATACTPEGLTIQLTRDTTNICVLSRGPRRAAIPHSNTTCMVAAVEASSGCFVVANRSPQGFYLQMGVATMRMEIIFASQQYDLPEEPTALTILRLSDVYVVLAGLSDGTLLIFCADDANNLHLLSSYHVQDVVPGAQSCTISSVEVLCRPQAPQGLVLCGLKTGILVLLLMSLDLNAGNAKVNVSFVDKTELGSTRVSIVREQGMNSINRGTLVTCESSLRRVSLLDEVGLQHEISPVWMKSNDDESASQPVINAVSRVLDHSAADINGLLVCVSENEILISSLVINDAVVPRRHKISGPPEKMVYSKYLKKLVVAIHTVEVIPAPRTGNKPSIDRRFRPALELVDPDIGNGPSGNDDRMILRIGENGDLIRALTEWRPADEKDHFELIVVGIYSDAPDHKLPSGRLLFVNLGSTRKLSFSAIKVSIGSRYPGRPVYSLHPHGMSSILVGVGNDIVLERFDMKTRKLSAVATFALPSSATSLYALGSLVYASTLNHSLLVLRRTEDTFETVASDTIARNVKNALILDSDYNVLNTITGEGACVVGLAKDHTNKQGTVLFDARIPLVLEGIQESNAPTAPRRTFDAISMDGTLHRLKILQHDEWQLLKFLEGFFRDDLNAVFRRLDPFLEEKPLSYPLDMHINGDLLASFVDLGPGALRSVLAKGRRGSVPHIPGVKTEEQKASGAEFKKLAGAVVGEGEGEVLVANVVKWLRDLMKIAR